MRKYSAHIFINNAIPLKIINQVIRFAKTWISSINFYFSWEKLKQWKWKNGKSTVRNVDEMGPDAKQGLMISKKE